MFLIHNFTNCNTTYTVYFSANDPCSFGGGPVVSMPSRVDKSYFDTR